MRLTLFSCGVDHSGIVQGVYAVREEIYVPLVKAELTSSRFCANHVS